MRSVMYLKGSLKFHRLCLFFTSLVLALFIFFLTYPTNCVGQEQFGQSANQFFLRINPEDVQLATLDSNPDPTSNAGDSPPDQWKSLSTSPNDPMDRPNPTLAKSMTNPSSAVSIPAKTATKYGKDDYGPLVGWGIRTAVGPAIQQSISARASGGEVYNTINFSPGFRSDFELFYNVTNGFYFGLESGFIYNGISSLNSSALPNQNLSAGSDDFGNGAFYQVPILANIRFQVPNSGKIRGYCTGGVGGVWDYLTISALGNNLSQHQWNYAFQLGAGFEYNLLPGLNLETAFKTFITPNPLLFSDSTSQVKASFNYSLEVGVAYRF